MSIPESRKPTIAVCGAGRCNADLAALAEQLGRGCALGDFATLSRSA